MTSVIYFVIGLTTLQKLRVVIPSEMDSMMNEVSDYLPVVKEVLIDERDAYLAKHIWNCNGNKVLAVLGAGHLKGVCAHLKNIAAEQETTDCSDIEAVPPKSIVPVIVGWAIPVVILCLLVLGYLAGGKETGEKGLLAWILWNGIPAGIGAVLSLANPVTILASIIAAPFTSLCPLIGVGLVAGFIQAVVCRPKVKDMETLQEDAGSLKGFYKNRILKVLLVFILSSLGSSIGTFAGGAHLIANIAGIFDKVKALLGM